MKTIEEIEKYFEKLFGKKISEFEYLEWTKVAWSDAWREISPEEFAEKYKKKIDLSELASYNDLSGKFLYKHRNKIKCSYLSPINKKRLKIECLKQNVKEKKISPELYLKEIIKINNDWNFIK